jgi:hypothetical protein
MTKIMTG